MYIYIHTTQWYTWYNSLQKLIDAAIAFETLCNRQTSLQNKWSTSQRYALQDSCMSSIIWWAWTCKSTWWAHPCKFNFVSSSDVSLLLSHSEATAALFFFFKLASRLHTSFSCLLSSCSYWKYGYDLDALSEGSQAFYENNCNRLTFPEKHKLTRQEQVATGLDGGHLFCCRMQHLVSAHCDALTLNNVRNNSRAVCLPCAGKSNILSEWTNCHRRLMRV